MNILDVIVLLVVGSFMYTGYRRGLMKTVFHFISQVVSLAISNAVYPYVTRYLRETDAVYETVHAYITKNLDLQALIGEQTLKIQTEFIQALKLPGFLTEGLLANNNPEFYKLLQVQSLEDYITGYLTNVCLNVISMFLVFTIVSFAMRMIHQSLGMIGRLPALKTFNRLGGLGIGFCQGTLVVWIGFILITLLDLQQQLSEMLVGSLIALAFYERNILMDMVAKIIT